MSNLLAWLGIMLFVNGSPASPQTISTGNTYLNPAFYRMDYTWATAQPSAPAAFRFNQAQDTRIANILSAGKQPLITLFVGQGWMTAPSSAKSGPPTDLSTTWNSAYGYSQTYYTFVHAFAAHYSNQIHYLAIENEQNSSLFWSGSAQDYSRLLKTAYKAVKDTDQSIQVMDGGVVGDVWGGCMTTDPAQLNTYYHRHLLHGRYDQIIPDRVIDTPQEAQAIIDATTAGCQKLNYFLNEYTTPSDGHPSLDLVNFHLYEDYPAIAMIQNWLTTVKHVTQPIATNELGLWDYDGYDTTDQLAQDVFKALITAYNKGISPLVWFSTDVCETSDPYPCSGNGRRSIALVDTQSQPYQVRPAANTYKFLSTVLVSTANTQYHGFWSDTGPTQIVISNPFINSTVDIYSYSGQLLQHYPQVSNLTLTVSGPILVKWTRPTLPDLIANWFSPSYDQTGDGKTNSLDFAKLLVR